MGVHYRAEIHRREDIWVLETTAACFADFTPEPGDGSKVTYFCLIGGLNKSLLIAPTEQRSVPKILGDTVATCGDGDFPVGICALEKSGVIFVVTKLGLVGMYTLKGGKFLHQETCPSKLFLVAKCVTAERFLCLDIDGQLWSIAPHPPGSTDPISNDFNGAKVTPGALTADVSRGSEQEPIGAAQGEPIPPVSADKSCPSVSTTSTADTDRILELIAQRKICEAAFRVSRLAHPRSEAYIAKLRDIPATPPLPQALVLYLCFLLDIGNLDEFESYELTRLAVEQGSTTLISQLVESGNKLSCSIAMGDILRPLDYPLSLKVYSKAKAFTKVFQILYERGDYDYIPTYTNAMNHGDIPEVLSVLLPLSTAFATKVATAILKDHPTELDRTLDCFTKAGCSREAQSLALDLLQGDRAEDSHIQTKALRLAFLNSPAEAESLLNRGMLSHYDKRIIIPLCVEAGLQHLALQLDPNASADAHCRL
ncbi:clathrin heavy chain [Pelomyxa schiedti]|nr:clathrin heavy chain [Pelomyxa schiedti]